jgi:hypothetical protein
MTVKTVKMAYLRHFPVVPVYYDLVVPSLRL